MRAPFAVLAAALALLLGLALSAMRAEAQGWADQPFDPAPMSREDIATLQSALAFSGDYYGFLDGVWNQDAQAALQAYVDRTQGGGPALYRHIAPVILALEDERVKNGWQLRYMEKYNISYLHPYEFWKETPNETAEEYLSTDSQFSIIIREDGFGPMKEVHDWFMGKSLPDADPFQYNDDVLWITSTTIDGDYIAYARSDRAGNSWLTFSVVLDDMYFSQLNLFASSVVLGGSPASLWWTEGGVIDQLINGSTTASAPPSKAPLPNDPKDQVRRPIPPGVAEAPPIAPPVKDPSTVDVAAVTPGPAPGPEPGGGKIGTPPAGAAVPEPEPQPEPDPQPSGLGTSPEAPPVMAPGSGGSAPVAEAPARPKVTGKLIGSGTAFYIGPNALVTAAHVIEGCGAVAMIDGTPLDIQAADSTLDLAYLTGATDVGAWLKLSALEVPKLGESVTALGYPYYTSLDQGLTVTSGNVSALRGADGSSNRVMITAPVQPGNSGGPLLNKKGAVIGVVVSRIDDLKVLEETGSLPQNMNFAVPSGLLLTFLAQARWARPQGGGTGAEVGTEIPAGVANAVIPLHCYE